MDGAGWIELNAGREIQITWPLTRAPSSTTTKKSPIRTPKAAPIRTFLLIFDSSNARLRADFVMRDALRKRERWYMSHCLWANLSASAR